MLNNKGYTLVELLATLFVLGIVMAVTIPNIAGISEQNKKTAYAEDAKKFKNTAEYMLRGDDTITKPETKGHCIIVNLRYVHGNDFDNPPYGGEYDMDNSFIVMVKWNNKYDYYVQLVEKFEVDGEDNYRGFSLIDYTQLEGDKYLDKITESTDLTPFVRINDGHNNLWKQGELVLFANRGVNPIEINISDITRCTSMIDVYYAK